MVFLFWSKTSGRGTLTPRQTATSRQFSFADGKLLGFSVERSIFDTLDRWTFSPDWPYPDFFGAGVDVLGCAEAVLVLSVMLRRRCFAVRAVRALASVRTKTQVGVMRLRETLVFHDIVLSMRVR